MVMILVACSSDENSSSGGGEVVDLTIGLPGSYEVTSKEIVDKFIEEHPNINVTIQEAPWGDFASKIATQIAGNTMPDVWFQENATILGYGERGVAEELTPYIERDLNAEDYVDALYSAENADGQIWGVPHGVNPVALAYNKDLFEEAGLDYPADEWTYEELIEAAKELTITDGDRTEQYGFVGSYSITTGWFPWLKQAGGSALDESKTKSMFNSQQSIDGLTQLRQGIEEGYFTSSDFLTANGGELEVFGMEKAAMLFIQYSLQVTMNESFPDTNWDTVKMPLGMDGERYVPMVNNTWLISSRAEEQTKEAAWEFLKFYLSEDVQNIVAESGSTLPVHVSALELVEESVTKPENKTAFTQGIAEGGVTLDENDTWSEWRLVAQEYVNEAIVNQNMSVEEAMEQTHKEVQAILGD